MSIYMLVYSLGHPPPKKKNVLGWGLARIFVEGTLTISATKYFRKLF